MKNLIRLSPHHAAILFMNSYYSKNEFNIDSMAELGYDNVMRKNEISIMKDLTSKDSLIKIVYDFDDICAKCPRNISGNRYSKAPDYNISHILEFNWNCKSGVRIGRGDGFYTYFENNYGYHEAFDATDDDIARMFGFWDLPRDSTILSSELLLRMNSAYKKISERIKRELKKRFLCSKIKESI